MLTNCLELHHWRYLTTKFYPVNSSFTQIFDRTTTILFVIIFSPRMHRIPWEFHEFSMFREIPEYCRFVATLFKCRDQCQHAAQWSTSRQTFDATVVAAFHGSFTTLRIASGYKNCIMKPDVLTSTHASTATNDLQHTSVSVTTKCNNNSCY